MGIRNIHILLIFASAMMAAVVGLWGLSHAHKVLSAVCLTAAVALVVYGIQFINKSK